MHHRDLPRRRRIRSTAISALLGGLALCAPVTAQPFGAWLSLDGSPAHGYARVPSSGALNPTGAITVEAWVSISNNPAGEDCRSIAGKNWTQAWWLGLCNVGGKPTLRSYLKGAASSFNAGQIEPNGRWTHVAVTSNGSIRRHYINGELAGQVAETTPLGTSTSEVRIGSDVSWQNTPDGGIDEVRVWNVARTQSQIRSLLQQPLTSDPGGLVAVWSFDGHAADVIGPHDGSLQGSGVGFGTFPVVFDCGASTATALCLNDRFQVRARWRTNPAPGTLTDGAGMTVGCANDGSGLFYFFNPDNWEVMVKALNGCGLNDRHWVFSAATTNVFYRLDVFDVREGVQKIYFNYPGPPAPAVTDTSAFATCP